MDACVRHVDNRYEVGIFATARAVCVVGSSQQHTAGWIMAAIYVCMYTHIYTHALTIYCGPPRQGVASVG